jgi:SAM-dependent methyltransferase
VTAPAGTGWDLHLFHSLGCEVLGSDISPSMLARAERNLASHHIDVPLEQIDYRELPFALASEFDAVTCLSSAIFEMPDDGELRRALASMRGVLRPGGILILSAACATVQCREAAIHTEINRGDFTLCSSTTISRGARFKSLTCTTTKPRGMPCGHHLRTGVPRADLEGALQAVGFPHVQFSMGTTSALYMNKRMQVAVAQK